MNTKKNVDKTLQELGMEYRKANPVEDGQCPWVRYDDLILFAILEQAKLLKRARKLTKELEQAKRNI